MAQCPVCHNELPDDFGLIDCGNCKTPLIVQFDGSVIAANQEPPVEAAPPPLPADPIPAEPIPDFEFAESPPTESHPEPEPEPAPEPAPDVDALFARNEEAPTPMIMTNPPPISDMSSLANSVDNATLSGVLRYTIEVSGIDTADIRNDFREMISDRRFLWDIEAIIKSIKSGTVKLEDVSAVKALLLVHRLRGLPVRVTWEQHVLHES